jgi:hypothetical protein
MHVRLSVLLVLLLHVAGIGLFIRGFLFIKRELTVRNTEHCGPLVSRPIRRLLLIVIDGLRYDFAERYLTGLLHYSNSSVFFETYSDPPTVTLQRLKSIATGSLPVFIEIGNNFDFSHETQEDSLISHFSAIGNVSVIGDETWVALFGPLLSKVFTAPSFDVHDIHGVDNVVFERFPSEMAANDSRLIIGHFLGVDHAGHVFGFTSREVIRKVRQIDEFLIEKVVRKLLDDDLLVVLSDHGMTDSGSHGGASPSETSSFLFAYSRSLAMNQTGKWRNQIDICPTIALLFGFPIPLGNLGSVIPDFFPDHFEAARACNERQFSLLLREEEITASPDEILSVFRQKWATFNLPFMFGGVGLMALSMLLLPQPDSFLAIFHGLSLFSDSFIFGENLAVQFLVGVRLQSPLARILGLFGKCREDTHRRICQPHLHIKSFVNRGFVRIIGDSFVIPLALYVICLIRCDRSAETIHFLSLHGFFALGHQFTFADLNIEAGFAFGSFHRFLSPFGVFLNTFMADFLGNAFVGDTRKLQTYRTLDLVCISAFAIYGRRHLMVWQAIAPRFLFQCALTLITDIFSLARLIARPKKRGTKAS